LNVRCKLLPALVLAVWVPLTGYGCHGPGPIQDPTLVIEGDGGSELGVNTDYGILFLGRHTRAGKIAVTAWFGDGPSLEMTIVEPVGGGIYTAETEIVLPSIPLTFVAPKPGTPVLVNGRRGSERWFAEAHVTTDPHLRAGILLDLGPATRLTGDQVGAPVFVQNENGAWRCLGVVTGRVRLGGPDGDVEYLTVLGPESTWRLVGHRRDVERRRRWVYREDILPG
jgi:hypothetical protein